MITILQKLKNYYFDLLTNLIIMSDSAFAKVKYQLNIKIITPLSYVKEFYTMFATHHNGDSGIDLTFNDELSINSFAVGTLNFGIQCEMIEIETNTFVSYYLLPR